MNNIQKVLKFLTLIIPLLFVYIPSIFFNVDNAGSEVPFRPPGYVFAIVWPILLILIGISWFKRTELSIYYLILCILLGAWVIIYFYSNLASFIEIILTLLFTIFLICYKFDKISSILLIPLALWLSFASVLNGYELKINN
jgi:benzodiazapine receptor